MTGFIIYSVIFAVVIGLVSKKATAAVCKKMGWDNPFISVKELMQQGHSFSEAMAISHAKREKFKWTAFLICASKLLPFGKRSGEWGFGKYLEYENARIREAEENAENYGGKVADYL